MRIIDIHTHIYPDEIAQKATASVRKFYELGNPAMTGTVSQLLEQGARAGIDRYVVLPVAIRPDRVQGINDYILHQTRLHDCFIGFGTVHAKMDGLMDEVERIGAMSLRGIKMHPDSQGFPIDDPALFPMYEAVQGKLPVMLHMGDRRYDHSHPARLRRVLNQFPRLQVIAAHFGGYSMYQTACDLLKDTECIFDVSSSLMILEEGEAERYIGIYGAERMAFGTDYPIWDPVKELERFLKLRLTDDQFEQILSKTAERIFNL